MRRFVPAVAASIALVLAAPFIGQLRSTLLAAFPNHYRTIIASAILGVVIVAIGLALWRIRDRRLLRYGCIAAAVGLGTGYARLSATGDPSVDVVERFHFIEYGLIAFLFYHAWHPAGSDPSTGSGSPRSRSRGERASASRSTGDASLLILPTLAGILVGTCEEWLQWFVPARVGEVRDVFLNLWAILCGLLFSIGFDPPARLALSLRDESWRRVRHVAAVVLLVIALFFHTVHLGYEITDTETGMFRSKYDTAALQALARDRAARWRIDPPLTWSRLSREDQYFSEGLTHVRGRNRCWDDGRIRCAWRENLILERYYAPVIDVPSYVSASGLRWPPAQRADAEQRAAGQPGVFSSEADEYPIYAWPKTPFWIVVAASVAALAIIPARRAP